uniref:Protein ZIP4 homolog n=1 Tax=Falco tinnunculus TaxID=100819 RepID=A0A8C4UW95_FALTI
MLRGGARAGLEARMRGARTASSQVASRGAGGAAAAMAGARQEAVRGTACRGARAAFPISFWGRLLSPPPLSCVTGLVQELLREEAPSRIAALTEELFQAAGSISEGDGGAAGAEPRSAGPVPLSGPPEAAGLSAAAPQAAALAQVEESAINLWNWTVTKHMGCIVNDEQRAKLRFVACRLVCFCEGSDPPEATIRRQILMSMKTGKGWIDIGKADLADEFLEIAMNSIEKLYAKLLKGSDGEADIHVHKADVEKNLFKVLSYQAESAVAQGDFQKAVMCMQRCKDMLMKLPRETCYLSILCYNFGVETYEWKRYEQSSFWLSQSYDIGKMDMEYSVGKEMRAKVLRLLATVCFEWDCNLYLDKALKAITLANQENIHPAGVFLKVKILLKSGASDEDINSAVSELLHHEMSLDFYLNTVKLLLEHGRESVGFDFLKSVPERFESSPDFGKITLFHIEFLLQNKRELLAKQKVEEVIIGHYTGKQLLPEALNQLHIILWDRAAKHYEAKNYSEALHWYSYSVSFYTPGQIDQNLAKLQRNMASCYLHLKQVDKNEQEVVAIKALEYLSEHLRDCRQLFAALKCLVRLTLSKVMTENEEKKDEDISSMLTYLTLAHKRLAESFTEENFTGDMRIFEAHWFRRVAWNLAVQFKDCPDKMRDFFLLSFKFSQFCPSDKAVLIAQRTCLLMAAAVDLEMGRQQVTPSEQMELLTQALQHLQACKEIWKVLKLTGDFAKDPTDTLLLLYEFEARSKLNDPTLYDLMESVWEQPQIEVKTLEIIASLAMESPARYPVLCKKALKSALNLHRKQTGIDAVKFSKCLHSLIDLSLPAGLTDLDMCVLQEVWDYFEDALNVVSSTDAYPEMEILWLMTRAWNTGILQYTVGKYNEAEQWCGLGMRFLSHLGPLKKSYESHMIGLYSEVLDKLDRAKGFLPNEE